MFVSNYPITINDKFAYTIPNKKITFCGAGVKRGETLAKDTVELFVSKSLKKLKDFSLENYSALSEEEKVLLREKYKELSSKSDFYRNAEGLHDSTTDSIKSYFDKLYGKDSYVVIMIGRSLSSIGKVLGYKLGKDNVKNIPMSFAPYFRSSECVEKLKKLGRIDELNSYLASIGLTKSAIARSGKQYVIMDYCFTGSSLEGATKLLKRDDVLGNSKKIVPHDIMDCLNNKNDKIRLGGYLQSSLFKNFSFVKESSFLKNISSSVVDPQQAELKTQLMWFKLLDNYMIKQQEKINSKHSQNGIINSIKSWFSNLISKY